MLRAFRPIFLALSVLQSASLHIRRASGGRIRIQSRFLRTGTTAPRRVPPGCLYSLQPQTSHKPGITDESPENDASSRQSPENDASSGDDAPLAGDDPGGSNLVEASPEPSGTVSAYLYAAASLAVQGCFVMVSLGVIIVLGLLPDGVDVPELLRAKQPTDDDLHVALLVSDVQFQVALKNVVLAAAPGDNLDDAAAVGSAEVLAELLLLAGSVYVPRLAPRVLLLLGTEAFEFLLMQVAALGKNGGKEGRTNSTLPEAEVMEQGGSAPFQTAAFLAQLHRRLPPEGDAVAQVAQLGQQVALALQRIGPVDVAAEVSDLADADESARSEMVNALDSCFDLHLAIISNVCLSRTRSPSPSPPSPPSPHLSLVGSDNFVAGIRLLHRRLHERLLLFRHLAVRCAGRLGRGVLPRRRHALRPRRRSAASKASVAARRRAVQRPARRVARLRGARLARRLFVWGLRRRVAAGV